MNFTCDHFEYSKEQAMQAYHDVLHLYYQSTDLLGRYYNEYLGVDKSDRFWQITLYKFLIKFSQDAVTGTRLTKKEQKSIDNLVIPYNDHIYSDLRHNNDQFYQQFFNEVDFNGAMDVVGFKKTGKKRSISNMLFKVQNKYYSGKNSIPLIKDYYPDYWKLHFRESKIFNVRLRNVNIIPDVNLCRLERPRLNEWLINNGMNSFYAKALAFSVPYNLLEQLSENFQKVLDHMGSSRPEKVLTSWVPDSWTALLCAEWVERGSKLHLAQHGAGYGEDPSNSANYIEQKMCDVFYGWSQKKYNHKVFPMAPTRMINFRVNYENYLKENGHNMVENKYDLLILDGMHYKTPTMGDLVGNSGSKRNIIEFLNSYGNGDGEGVLLRLYRGNYAKNDDFEAELVNSFPKLTLTNDRQSMIFEDFYQSKEILMNMIFSTAKWEAASIGKPVDVILPVPET